jgi:hypothetical protein
MTSEAYDEKRRELEDSQLPFASFGVSAGLVGFALMLVQAIL